MTAITKAVKKSKPVKEMKNINKPKTAAHPPYFEMIKDAILALNEKGGSSPYAIAKFMEGKHKSVLPPNFRKIMALQLKNCALKGKLIKIRASYKLADSGKKSKPAAAVKKPRTAAGTKKKTAAVAKPKQLKSIKSPLVVKKKAKRANLAAVV